MRQERWPSRSCRVLDADAGRPQTTSEGVLEVVDPNLREARADAIGPQKTFRSSAAGGSSLVHAIGEAR
jgi:hypothetical protein